MDQQTHSAPADQSEGAESYTIYCHIHIETGRRYVGLTKHTMLHRWNRHVYDAVRRRYKANHFHNAIRKYGKEAFSHEVLEVCHSLGVANLAEECWIEFYDTRNPEKGFNVAKGGATWKTRPDNAYRFDPCFKARVSANAKRLWQDPQYRQRVVSASQAITKSAGFRQAMSETVKGLWQDPSFREKNLIAAAASYTPERVEKLSRRWDDSDFRERCSVGTKARNAQEAAKTHCKNGHEYTPETTYISKFGGRECVLCSYARRKAVRTHCPKGHEYTAENTRWKSSGLRICLTCHIAARGSRPCSKCGGPKEMRVGGRMRCRPCTNARINAWQRAAREAARSNPTAS